MSIYNFDVFWWYNDIIKRGGILKRITLRLPTHLWKKVKSVVEYKGCTINSFIIELLWDYVEKCPIKEDKEQDK